MFHLMTKRFGIATGTLLFAAALIGIGTQVPSCASKLSPERKAAIVKLADIGLAIAQSQGEISTGDRILIRDTTAVILSEGSAETKLVQLADLGLKEALKEGVIQPGDMVVVKDDQRAVIEPPPPAVGSPEPSPPPAADPASGSK